MSAPPPSTSAPLSAPASTPTSPPASPPGSPVLIRAAGVALLIDVGGQDGLPAVLHWGRDVGELDQEAARRLAEDLIGAVPHSALDRPWPFTLLPSQVDGWSGRPGLSGDRDGAALFPRWRTGASSRSQTAPQTEPDGAQRLVIDASSDDAALGLRIELRMEACGLVRIRHTITSTVSPGTRGMPDYRVGGLLAMLPLPETATTLEDLTGRWCRERGPQRGALNFGSWVRESRRGRTGHDAPLLLTAGTAGFGFRSGEVWAAHVAWSGDGVHLVERLPEGAGSHGGAVLGGGELLAPGEVSLAPGESYTSPWVVFSYSADGLDGATARVHRWLRARSGHPRRPRPLVLNTWEAVYFDHDLQTLTALAERAAAIGVERFVLDDGWFGGRRHDRAGLGDWVVSPQAWPHGLRPLADRVRSLGMEFGLWFEPEMVNLDSDLARAHPDWLLTAEGSADRAAALPRSWRHQYPVNLAEPGAFDYLLQRLDSLVGEIGVAFIKWDHNRDLHEAPAHAQTAALYRLLDELRSRHPALEIESCASGGARVDLGILQRTDRVWASDTNDPLERQQIQRWTSSLLPLELIGSHIGAAVSHTTGRTSELSLRCLTALFGHAGIEWDITSCTEAEMAALIRWAALYKELRPLLHSGDLVRADFSDASGSSAGHVHPDLMLQGVVAADRSEAVFTMVRIRTSPGAHPGRIRLPGLDPARSYRVLRRDEAGPARGPAISQPPWWERGETVAGGAVLGSVGLAAPLLDPGQGILVQLTAV